MRKAAGRTHGLTAEAARWAVESWALALDLVTKDEYVSAERVESAFPPASKADR